jgi:hydroxyacylglutathione hydrolase
MAAGSVRAEGLQVTPIPYNADNFAFLIRSARDPSRGVVVDAGDASAVTAFLRHAGVTALEAVFSTHGHADHVGGNEGMTVDWPGVVIVGGAGEWKGGA